MRRIAMRHASHRSNLVLLTAGLLAAATLAACSSSEAARKAPTLARVPASVAANDGVARAAFFAVPATVADAPAGTVVRHQVVTGVPGVPEGAEVQRLIFHSRTIYGEDALQSGYVITPAGKAPAGGWTTVAWAHGTSGYAAPCGPSRLDADGPFGLYLLPGLADFLNAGYAVSAADYQGLGLANGMHPYLVGRSEGQSVLDALRASNALLDGQVSGRAIIYGHSQGGHAALFAAEIAKAYAPELNLLGSVAAAPATGMSGLATVASSDAGAGFMPFAIPAAWGWSQAYRDLPASDLFTPQGIAFARAEVMKGCTGSLVEAIRTSGVKPTDLFKADAGANANVRRHGLLNDPGRVKTDLPLLVVQGGADTTVPAALTDGFIAGSACPKGDTVAYLKSPTANHGTIVFAAIPAILSWMGDRLAGRAAPTTCGQPGNASAL